MSFSEDPAYAAFWLEVARSDLAAWIQLTPYAYAVIESAHLVGVAFFFGPLLLLDLRLLGALPRLLAGPAGRFLLRISLPAFLLLTSSGALLFVPSADRYASSPVFFAKLAAMAIGGVNALVSHLTAWRRIDAWGASAGAPRPARLTAAVSVLVWLGVIALGRALGYERRDPPPSDLDELGIFETVPPAGD